MFDAKSLIEMLMKGASPQPVHPQGGQGGGGQAGGGLGDILGQLGGMVGGGQGQNPMQQGRPMTQQGADAGGQIGGLDDILRKLGVNVPAGQGGQDGSMPGSMRDSIPGSTQSSAAASGGGLGDILGQLQKQFGGAASGAPGAGGASGGSIMDVLGQILGQATAGVKDGAGRIDGATGASGHMRDALAKATGQSPDELLAKLKDLIGNNQMATGAGLGGLGALVLGTKAGRSMAGSAVKLGALALIGGLAYKAYQNYSNGQAPFGQSAGPGAGHAFAHEAAPQGSGFEADAISQDQATVYLRAMIAAAAADGRIDADERSRILGGLQSAGITAQAQAFLEQEIANPATVEDLVASVTTPQEAVQVYTAARVAIDPNTPAEAQFLAQLAAGLGMDRALAAHIDAAARTS